MRGITMNKPLELAVQKFITDNKKDLVQLIIDISAIPSPTGSEQKKAEWVLEKLNSWGAKGAHIDEAGNVIYPYHLEKSDTFPLYNAHIDTVFNNVTTIEPKIDGHTLYAPSCGDNSSSVAGLLFLIRMLHTLKVDLPTGILFAFNVGEEGLGNLKGSRYLVNTWKEHLSEVIAVDGSCNQFVNLAVGSRRYTISITAEGGHSWEKFGNSNAIAAASSIICQLYMQQVPTTPKTTYNVGTICGGSTVNSIAEQVEFTIDLRSESKDELERIDGHLTTILQKADTEKIQIKQTLIGERPCSQGITQAEIYDRIAAIRENNQQPMKFHAASTDANIPLSMGIPAISFGICEGTRAHSIYESIDLDTLEAGMNQLAAFLFFHM